MSDNRVSIQNFKSLRNVQFDARRVNVFVGEPNSGKSNIIEALSLFSLDLMYGNKFHPKMVRMNNIPDLFSDSDIHFPISISFGNYFAKIEYQKNDSGVWLHSYEFKLWGGPNPDIQSENVAESYHSNSQQEWDYQINSPARMQSMVKRFAFEKLDKFRRDLRPFLNSPHGENLPDFLLLDKEVRSLVAGFIAQTGFRLNIKPNEYSVELIREKDDAFISIPYSSLSDTLQRVVFLMTAIETSENSILLLDEPEAHTFPFYTKYIAERIAYNDTNQYFITTHNPYLLMNLIEKTNKKDLAVFITTMQDFETQVYLLKEEQLSEAFDMGSDFFFNFEKFIS